jgi:AAA domain
MAPNEPPRANGGNGHTPAEVCTAKYDYRDESGALLFQVGRHEQQFAINGGKRKKTFRQKRPDHDRPGQWIYNVDGVRTVPYRLPELIEAIANQHPVLIVEGEAKVDLLHSWNIPATCNAAGAGKWKPEHSEFLQDADVIILPDNDDPGRNHADTVAASLQGIARSVRVLELPGLEPKGDIVDWAKQGGTVEQLHDLIVREAKPWKLPAKNDDNNESNEQPTLIKSSRDFVAGFVPPDYLVDGLLQEAFLYSLTGATGAGKTAITLRLAASVALGVVLANRETKKRRVLYLAAENPVDVRMRWIALAQQMDFDADAVGVYFVEGSFRISQMGDKLKEEAARVGGDFGLVIIDTGPVFYEGDDENNRTQQGRHAEMLRGLIDIIPGRPAVIANVHPVKNAAADNLLPAGGGNFLNQVDGNLTAAKTDNTTELHWQGKFRGVEFAPMHFMLRTVTHDRLKDSKGRLIPTVVCDWISDGAKEEIKKQRVNDEDRLLQFIQSDPKASLADLATKMDWKLFNGEPNKMRVSRTVKAAKGQALEGRACR